MRTCDRCGKQVVPGTGFCIYCGFAFHSTGPERPTVLERFFRSVHLPFAIGCFLLAFLFLPAATWIAEYADSGTMSPVVAPFLTSPVGVLELIAAQVLTGALWFTLFYLPKYMRMRILRAKRPILPVLADQAKTFDAAFGRVSSGWGPVILGVAAVAVLFALDLSVGSNTTPSASSEVGVFELVLAIAQLVLLALGFGSFIWVYLSSVNGLHSLGKGSLRLRPFYGDPTLGLRPVGSLSLSLTSAYFVVVALQGVLSLLGRGLVDIALTAFLTLLGIVMFFLPLYRIHRAMLVERTRAQDAVRDLFSRHVSMPEGADPVGPDGTLAEVRDHLVRLANAFTVDLALREARAVRTWPFDTRILTGLGTIILSVVSIILARVIQLQLGL